MNYNTKEEIPQEENRVRLVEVSEIIYWTEKFHCSATELLIAVEAVGDSAVDVDDYLGSL